MIDLRMLWIEWGEGRSRQWYYMGSDGSLLYLRFSDGVFALGVWLSVWSFFHSKGNIKYRIGLDRAMFLGQHVEQCEE